MRSLSIVIGLLACGGRSLPPPAEQAPPAEPIPCGDTTCPPDQWCVFSSYVGGVTPAPGQPADSHTSYGCHTTPPRHCGKPIGRNVLCESVAP